MRCGADEPVPEDVENVYLSGFGRARGREISFGRSSPGKKKKRTGGVTGARTAPAATKADSGGKVSLVGVRRASSAGGGIIDIGPARRRKQGGFLLTSGAIFTAASVPIEPPARGAVVD